MRDNTMRVRGRVGVLMSGGVDSSVAAYLLLRDGWDVHGLFITIWNPPHVPCTAAADKQDAMRACAVLGIPFVTYDATEVYREKVIEPFVEAYRLGETPNPDVLCNQFVKFDAVAAFAHEKGFTHIATGHYARVQGVGGARQLYRSVDANKDQTYFIYTISQEVLNRVLFPIGGYTKDKVRSIAADARLPAAQKKDSTGLCFLGDVSMKDFLSVYIQPKEGEVLLYGSDKPIGTHDGAWFYTPGQRHGFTITVAEQGPYTVVEKDVQRNIVFVRRNESAGNGSRQHALTDCVFRRMPTQQEQLFARYRHRGLLHPITLSIYDAAAESIFEKPQEITAGQSVVVYTKAGECIGGGTAARQTHSP